MFRPLPLVLTLLILTVADATAQSQGSPTLASKVITASPIVDGPVRVDGVLDDSVWESANWRSDFLQREPVEGGIPAHATEVAVVYDDAALYIGARMESTSAESIRRSVTRRDNETNAEQIAVSLDTYNNGRTAYTFAVTAGGVRIDYYHDEDRQGARDYSFDPVWTAEVDIQDTGWSAEMRIPYSQLRFNNSPIQEWGININRDISASNEDIYWIYVPRDESGWASRFGRLVGLEGIRPARRLELLPYVATGSNLPSDVDENDPFRSSFENDIRAGLDVKMGLGSNLTLDATFNPDFGQVEADPAEVNLSAFETFFSERRPFFSEGSDLLGSSHFYSRRIGRAPRGSVSGDFVDRPDNTTILGAAKLSGRLSSGFSVAALGAATQAESARVFDIQSGNTSEVRIEPFAAYLAVAGAQEFGPNASTVRVLATGVRRDLSENDPLSSVLNDEAYTGELSWNLRFRGGAYEFGGAGGATHVSGTPARIAALQNSSVHYYQRPDASYISVDSSKTSLNGFTTDVWVQKNNGRFTGFMLFATESPGYDPNDLGRLSRADEISWYTEVGYRQTRPGMWYHRYDVEVANFSSWNFGGQRNTIGFDGNVDFTWKNFWSTEVFAGFNPRDYSDTATRGGPRMAVSPERNVGFEVATNTAKRFSTELYVYYETDDLGRRDFVVAQELAWEPSERIELSFEPGWEKRLRGRQYVATRDGGPAETFGSRYIFSSIDRTEISGELRLNYTFSPDISLELYAEPFAASGNFYDFGQLTAAESLTLLKYGMAGTTIELDGNEYLVTDGVDSFSFPQRDFNVRSFRSNLVFRWEYRPGSTLFVVWQQDRSGFEPVGRFVRPGDLVESFSDMSNNFFSIKLTYWLPTG